MKAFKEAREKLKKDIATTEQAQAYSNQYKVQSEVIEKIEREEVTATQSEQILIQDILTSMQEPQGVKEEQPLIAEHKCCCEIF